MRIRRQHVTEARFSRGNERIVGSNGEINAGSTRELAQRLAELASLVASGDVAPLTNEEVASAEERREAVVTAYHDHETAAWAELGAAITGEIVTRVEREGFLRSIFDRHDLQQGQVPRIRVREPNTRAVISRSVTQVVAQYVRDKYITADEFHVQASPYVTEIDLQQGSADILEDKYFEGLEQILVQEDQVVKRLFDTTVGIYNDATYFASGLTPSILGSTKTTLETWRLPATNFIFSIDLLNDIAFGDAFSEFFDPVSKYEIVMTGRIGNIFGLNMITDGYREPTLQVLDTGEFYISTVPNLLGGYTERGPVKSVPDDQAQMGIPARGWRMSELISVVLANAKGVIKGKRISNN